MEERDDRIHGRGGGQGTGVADDGYTELGAFDTDPLSHIPLRQQDGFDRGYAQTRPHGAGDYDDYSRPEELVQAEVLDDRSEDALLQEHLLTGKPLGSDGSINAEALFQECLQSVRLPRIRLDGTFEEPPTLPLQLPAPGGKPMNSKALPSVGARAGQTHLRLLEYDHTNVGREVASLAKRLALTLCLMFAYVAVSYWDVFNAPWGAGAGIGINDEATIPAMAARPVAPSLAGVRPIAPSPAHAGHAAAAASANDALPEGLELHSDRRLQAAGEVGEAAVGTPNPFMQDSQAAVDDFVSRQSVSTSGQPSGSADAEYIAPEPPTGWVPSWVTSGEDNDHNTPVDYHPWTATSSQEGIAVASGTLHVTVAAPAAFAAEPRLQQAFATAMTAVLDPNTAYNLESNIFARAFATGPHQAVIYFSIFFPGWDKRSREVLDKYAGLTALSLATEINYQLEVRGSEQAIRFMSVSPLRTPEQGEVLWALRGRMIRWVVLVGALIGLGLVALHSSAIAEHLISTVNFAQNKGLTEAMDRLRARLSTDVVRYMEEASTVQLSGGTCAAPRKEKPQGFAHAASGVVSEMIEGLLAAERLVDREALRPDWCPDKRDTAMRIGTPAAVAVALQLLFGLLGIGPLVTVYGFFATSKPGPVRGVESSPFQAPRGAFECSGEGQVCQCSGAVYHGNRFVEFATAGEPLVSFKCSNSSLVPKGSSCVCDPFAQNLYNLSSVPQVISLAMKVPGFNALVACTGDESFRSAIEGTVQGVVAHIAGLWVTPAHVHVAFPPQSGKILAFIVPPGHVGPDLLQRNLQQSKQALEKDLMSALNDLGALQAASSPAEQARMKIVDLSVRSSPGNDAPATWSCTGAQRRLASVACPEGSFQAEKLQSCAGDEVNFNKPVASGTRELLFKLYEGTQGAHFLLAAPTASRPLAVAMLDTSTNQVVLDASGPVPKEVDYNGLTIKCPVRGQTVECEIAGVMPSTIEVSVFNNEDEAIPVDVHYEYVAINPCPSPPPGCSPYTSEEEVHARQWLWQLNKLMTQHWPSSSDGYSAACLLSKSAPQVAESRGTPPAAPSPSAAPAPPAASTTPSPAPSAAPEAPSPGGASPGSGWQPPAPSPETFLPASDGASPGGSPGADDLGVGGDAPSWAEVALEAQEQHEEAAHARVPRRLASLSGAEAACQDGISWSGWAVAFNHGADTRTARLAFHLLDADGNRFLSKDEFIGLYKLSTSASKPAEPATRTVSAGSQRVCPKRPSLMALQGGDWPDERALSQQVDTLLIQMWTNVILWLATGLLLGWPLQRYLSNSALDEIEENLREQLKECQKIMVGAGNIQKMQLKADILHARKEALREELEREKSNCCVM